MAENHQIIFGVHPQTMQENEGDIFLCARTQQARFCEDVSSQGNDCPEEGFSHCMHGAVKVDFPIML